MRMRSILGNLNHRVLNTLSCHISIYPDAVTCLGYRLPTCTIIATNCPPKPPTTCSTYIRASYSNFLLTLDVIYDLEGCLQFLVVTQALVMSRYIRYISNLVVSWLLRGGDRASTLGNGPGTMQRLYTRKRVLCVQTVLVPRRKLRA